MIAIDLSPLVFAPQRGVARALRHLLQGLGLQGPMGPSFVGIRPAMTPECTPPGLDALNLVAPRTVGPAWPRPVVWRRALSGALGEIGARVLLSPWASFPHTSVPVVAWIHEVPFARHGALEGTLRTMRHRRALARAVERAAALVVPAEAVRTDLLHLHPEARQRVHVVPHGFDPRPWHAAGLDEAAGTRADAALSAEPYALLLGTGRGAGGAKKKGVDVFVRAFEDVRLTGLTPVVVGTAPELPATVRVLPEPDDVELRGYLSRARLLVVPSRSEGFGYPMLEAFAAGVPVVASAAGALPEVSGGAARLVPPGDVEALAEAILRVHTDEDLRARLIKAGLRRAQEFPVEAMARGWLRVLAKAGGLPWHD